VSFSAIVAEHIFLCSWGVARKGSVDSALAQVSSSDYAHLAVPVISVFVCSHRCRLLVFTSSVSHCMNSRCTIMNDRSAMIPANPSPMTILMRISRAITIRV